MTDPCPLRYLFVSIRSNNGDVVCLETKAIIMDSGQKATTSLMADGITQSAKPVCPTGEVSATASTQDNDV